MSRGHPFKITNKAKALQHPDLKIPWVQSLLSDPDVEPITEIPEKLKQWEGEGLVSNTMFNYTLAHESGIRARVLLRRPCPEADAYFKYENCFILSLGSGLDGRTGRAHGGLTSLILDYLTGVCAQREAGKMDPPATATLSIDYKAAIATPTVILARAWIVEISGRKVFLRGSVEDGYGLVYATGKALFIIPRDVPKTSL